MRWANIYAQRDGLVARGGSSAMRKRALRPFAEVARLPARPWRRALALFYKSRFFSLCQFERFNVFLFLIIKIYMYSQQRTKLNFFLSVFSIFFILLNAYFFYEFRAISERTSKDDILLQWVLPLTPTALSDGSSLATPKIISIKSTKTFITSHITSTPTPAPLNSLSQEESLKGKIEELDRRLSSIEEKQPTNSEQPIQFSRLSMRMDLLGMRMDYFEKTHEREIETLSRDIERVYGEIERVYGEIERVYALGKWFIATMLTMVFGFLGLFTFKFELSSKDSKKKEKMENSNDSYHTTSDGHVVAPSSKTE